MNEAETRAKKSILEMTACQARAFLLKPESYCNIELPVHSDDLKPIFDFEPVLTSVANELLGKDLSSMSSRPRDHEVNYMEFVSDVRGSLQAMLSFSAVACRKTNRIKPRSVIRITPLSLLTLNSISLVLCSAPSAYACYASGAVLARG